MLKKCSCSKYLEKKENLKVCLENEIFTIYGNLNKGQKIVIKYHGKLLNEKENKEENKIVEENIEKNLIENLKENENKNNNNNEKEKKIFLYYGYGNLWSDKGMIEMDVCNHSDKQSYCVALNLINVENLFLCFMDNNNNWDLNESSSYIIKIDNPMTTLTKKLLSVALTEEDYWSTNKFFKNIINKFLCFFEKIGNIFDKMLKT